MRNGGVTLEGPRLEYGRAIGVAPVDQTIAAMEQQFAREPILTADMPVMAPGEPVTHDQLLAEVRRTVAAQPVEARSREDGADDTWTRDEAYSHSLRLIGIVGKLAVEGKLDTAEGRIYKESLRDRFRCSVIEMLHTDRTFREKLEIVYERKHWVRDGKVMAHDGKTRMRGICDRGALKAARAAEGDPRMQTMAERCAADAHVAERVEALPVGSVMMGLSVYPKEAMERYGKEFYENHGFREGLSFLQWYYRLDENTLLAATYSIDHNDIESLRQVWNQLGGDIPADEGTNTWLDHDLIRKCSVGEARKWACNIRDLFYGKVGVHRQRYSVDEFWEANQAAANQLFESLYMDMAVAHETRQLDTELSTFLDGVLRGRQHLSDEIQQQLASLRQRPKLTSEDIALIEQLVRYGAAEHLRKGLPYIGDNSGRLPANLYIAPVGGGISPGQYIALVMSGGVIDGARNNRTYGGCTVAINLSRNKDGTLNINPQGVFGGLGETEEDDRDDWEWTQGMCQIDECLTRPSIVDVGPCSICHDCQDKFDGGMSLEEIIASYRTIKGLAERVLKPVVKPGLYNLMHPEAEAAKPAIGIAPYRAVGRVSIVDALLWVVREYENGA